MDTGEVEQKYVRWNPSKSASTTSSSKGTGSDTVTNDSKDLLPTPLQRELFFHSGGKFIPHGFDLKLKHIWKLPENMTSESAYETFAATWRDEKAKHDVPYLIRALFRYSRYEFFLGFTLYLIHALLNFMPTILLTRMINYVDDPTMPFWYGFMYTGIVLGSCIVGSLCYFHYGTTFQVARLKVRAALMHAIYLKTFAIPKSQEFNPGHVINLFWADTSEFYDLSISFVECIGGLIQIIASSIYLAFFIGKLALIPFGVYVVLIPIVAIAVRVLVARKNASMESGDRRLRLTSELFQGIQIIKYYAWEVPFTRRIERERSIQAKHLEGLGISRTVLYFIIAQSPIIGMVLTLLMYGLNGENSALVNFVIIAAINTHHLPIQNFTGGLIGLAYALSIVSRIQHYLLSPEKQQYVQHVPNTSKSENAVLITNASFKWDVLLQTPAPTDGDTAETVTVSPRYLGKTLNNVSLKIPTGKLTIVVGKVGSGKSSLLMSILGEIPIQSGEVKVTGDIGYVPQQAWIINTTLRENILFGTEYNKEKYDKILSLVSLHADLATLPAGDLTEIGERGVNLSGGQKQRVSIARALYAGDKDVYLFDDPFSAVDSRVGNHIFSKVILEYLAGKTVVLVTNHLHTLTAAHKVVFLENGQIEGDDTLKNLQQDVKFSAFVKSQAKLEESEAETPKTQHSSSSSSSSSDANLVQLDEEGGEYGITESELERQKLGVLIQEEEREMGPVSGEVWASLVKASGAFNFIGMTLPFFSSIVVYCFGLYWVGLWSTAQSQYSKDLAIYNNSTNNNSTIVNDTIVAPKFDIPYWTWSYAAILLAYSFVGFIEVLFATTYFPLRAAEVFHTRLLHNLSRGTLSFFQRTPLGRILTRFTTDIYTVDTSLGYLISNFGYYSFMLVASLVGFSISSWYLLLGFIPWLILFVVVLRLYLTTNISLRRLETVSSADPVSHMNSTVSGVESIRAFKKINQFSYESFGYTDVNHAVRVALELSRTFFGTIGNFIAILIVFVVYGGISVLRTYYPLYLTGPFVGIALASTSGFTLLITLLYISIGELEMKMNSVERFRDYSNVKQEKVVGSIDKPENWPNNGKIEFSDLSFKYQSGPLVFDKLNFTIEGGSKVGVVGRTGAGKSSLLQSLFRIEEPVSGTIYMDGVDYSQLGLNDLRSSLAIIPQDPTLFSGTLRYNLDPFEEHSDADIWNALEIVQLKKFVESHPRKLDRPCDEQGANFSVGQRQLLCMSRALLRKSKILLLDEATASVDTHTDDIIQQIVKTSFKSCTVVTIAHRINTIMNYDKVIVMQNGKIVEHDSPSKLIQSKGVFYSMAVASGLVGGQ